MSSLAHRKEPWVLQAGLEGAADADRTGVDAAMNKRVLPV